MWLPSSNSLTAVETYWVNGKLKSLKINSCERPVTKALLMLSAPHRLFVWGVWLFQGISLTRPALLRYPDLAAATITGVPFLGRPTLFRAVRVRVLSPGRHQFTGTDWLQRTFQVDCDQSTTSNIRRWLTLSIPKRNERVIAKDSSTIQHVAKYTQVLKCHSYQQLTGLWYERNGQQNKFGRHRCC